MFQMAWVLEPLARGDEGMKKEQLCRQVNSETGMRRDSAKAPTITRAFACLLCTAQGEGLLSLHRRPL